MIFLLLVFRLYKYFYFIKLIFKKIKESIKKLKKIQDKKIKFKQRKKLKQKLKIKKHEIKMQSFYFLKNILFSVK